jgi:hypothetical protein
MWWRIRTLNLLSPLADSYDHKNKHKLRATPSVGYAVNNAGTGNSQFSHTIVDYRAIQVP